MILIDAVFIHSGGGKSLLDYLIEELNKTGQSFYYLFDSRLRNNFPFTVQGQYEFADGFIQRCCFYNNHKNKFSKVFCLGNIPPHIRLKKTNVLMYFHSLTYLTPPEEGDQKFMNFIKKKVFFSLVSNADQWLVQTESVKKLLNAKINTQKEIKVVPFFKLLTPPDVNSVKEPDTFLYLGTADPHKNHKRLIDAFCLFYDQYKKGVLIITVGNQYPQIYKYVENKIKKNYPIRNLGYINDKRKVALEYTRSKFVIFPSLKESFGLPLVESLQFNCKILAADLDYVKQVCHPSYQFDPRSTEQIFNAFEKALNGNFPESKSIINDKMKEMISIIVS
ncbi:glycosyltransferase [Chryseobacterium nematophagum]|uniref:Glycosyltransferase n=1 Tax=Chryseobacterium nematophagum TaxID=2305228 RepID=A0A3M7LB94_9FLAO|nr:glycosyltransferase [Chryseobacterium nematophagum]RMZ59324.1 glycosyltransferase [Chryseobacterium nematophagum]